VRALLAMGRALLAMGRALLAMGRALLAMGRALLVEQQKCTMQKCATTAQDEFGDLNLQIRYRMWRLDLRILQNRQHPNSVSNLENDFWRIRQPPKSLSPDLDGARISEFGAETPKPRKNAPTTPKTNSEI